MPIHASLREHNLMKQYPPMLIGVPIIHRVNLGHVYQVAHNQPHVLAFPFVRDNTCRVDILLTADHHSTSLRVRSAAFTAESRPGHYHAEYFLPCDRLAPIFLMFDGLQGTHKLIIKTSHMTPGHVPHCVTHTLLVQQHQQVEYDFHAEAIERFRFRIAYQVQEALIIQEQLIDPHSTPDAIWHEVYETIARSHEARLPQFHSPCLQDFEDFLKELDSHLPGRRPHLAAICILLEYHGTAMSTLASIKAFLARQRLDGIELDPLSVLPTYRTFDNPNECVTISMAKALTLNSIKTEPADSRTSSTAPSVASAHSIVTVSSSPPILRPLKQEKQEKFKFVPFN